MSDINWGLLQPASSEGAIRSATPSAPGAQLPSSGTAPSPTMGMEGFAQNQMAQQQLQMEKARQPGILAGQDIQNQGGILKNQVTQSELAANKYALETRQAVSAAGALAKKTGGTEAELDAMQNMYLDRGDTDTYGKIATTRETLQEQKASDDRAGIMASGSMVHNVMSQVVPPTPALPPRKDPQTGQVLPPVPANPGRTALDVYTAQYPTIKRADPRAPDPNTFRDDAQFQDAYVHPVLAAALPIQTQVAAQQKFEQTNKIAGAQKLVRDNTLTYKNAVAQHGADSDEAKEAKNQLDQANQSAIQESQGPIAGNIAALAALNKSGGKYNKGALSIQNIGSAVFGLPEAPIPSGTAPTPINGPVATPRAAAPSSPGVPNGRVAVKAPDGTIGHIPAAQLQDAIKSGYSPIQGQ